MFNFVMIKEIKHFLFISFAKLKKRYLHQEDMIKWTHQWLLEGYIITIVLGISFSKVNQEP